MPQAGSCLPLPRMVSASCVTPDRGSQQVGASWANSSYFGSQNPNAAIDGEGGQNLTELSPDIGMSAASPGQKLAQEQFA